MECCHVREVELVGSAGLAACPSCIGDIPTSFYPNRLPTRESSLLDSPVCMSLVSALAAACHWVGIASVPNFSAVQVDHDTTPGAGLWPTG